MNEFDGIYNLLNAWFGGPLGKFLSTSLVLVGVVGGIVRQSFVSMVIGVGGGVAVFSLPIILTGILGDQGVLMDQPEISGNAPETTVCVDCLAEAPQHNTTCSIENIENSVILDKSSGEPFSYLSHDDQFTRLTNAFGETTTKRYDQLECNKG
jgi:hypothetical protein